MPHHAALPEKLAEVHGNIVTKSARIRPT